MFAASSLSLRDHSQNRSDSTGITEVVLANPQSFELLLPTLAYLSRKTHDRWFTWIAPDGLSKQLAIDYGFNMSKVRFVHPTSAPQAFDACKLALSIGNSESVIASLGRLTNERFAELEAAASHGRCSGLLLRYR